MKPKASKMNVLIVTPKLFTTTIGGVPTVVRELARGLNEKGHKVLIVTDTDPGYAKSGRHEGIDYIQMPLRYRNIFNLLYFVLNLFKTFKADIVNVHYPISGQAVFSFFYSLIHNIPLVASLHYREAWHPHFIDRFTASIVCRRAEKVAACSIFTARKSAKHLKCKVMPIYNGVDSVIKHSVNKRENIIVYAGRLSKEKNIDTLIKAFSSLAIERKDAKLIVAGTGPQEEQLKVLANNLGLGQIEFIDYRTKMEIYHLFEQALSVVVPTVEEAFGLVILEAMTMGAITIGSNSGGIPELIQDGYNGYLFEPSDVNTLSEKMKYVIDNQEKLQTIRGNALNTTQKFTWAKMVAEYEKLYYETSK